MKTRKHILTYILVAIVFMLTGCDKLPINGDLDGLWQLMEIKQGDDIKEVKTDRLYCSFQLHMFMLGDDGHPRGYFGNFEHEGNTMRFYNFTYRSDYTQESNYDKFMSYDKDKSVISPWGFYSTDCTFDVVKLNSSELILQHENLIIKYRKL